MSGNIHFDVTGSNENFKRVMQDTRREIQDTENEASDALDSIIERLHENTQSGDLFGLKDAVADGKIQLEVLRDTIGKVSDAIDGMTSESEKQAALEVVEDLKERYDQLAESVEEGEAALKAMRRALIAGGAAIGVAAVAAVALVVVIRRVTKECREMNASVEAGFAAARGQASQWLADYSKAQALWRSAQGDVEKLNAILRDHRDILDASGVAIKDINDGDRAFIDNADAMVDAIKKRAVAMAFEQAAATAAGMAADEYLKAEEKIAKRENRRVNSPIVRFFNRLNYEGVEGGEEWDYQRMAQNDRDAAEKSAETRLKMVQKLSEASVDAWKEYEDALAALGLSTTSATKAEKEHQQALDDTIVKLQRYADAVAKLREQQALATSRQRASLQDRIEQAEIDAMQEGYEKEQAQRELNQRRELEMIKQAKEEYIRAYRERAKAIWDAEEEAKAQQDPSYGKRKFDPSGTTPDTGFFDTLYRATVEKQQNDLINPLLSQYQTYEEKRQEIMRRGAADVSALLSKGYKDQANVRRQQTQRELSELKAQELAQTDVWKKLLGDLSEISTDLLLTYIDTAEEMLDSTSNLTAEDLKVFKDAVFNAREDVIRRNPFKALKEAHAAYQKAVEEGDEQERRRAAKTMGSAYNEAGNNIQTIVGTFSQVAGLFGSGGQDIAGVLNDVGSAIGNISSALSAFSRAESEGGSFADSLQGVSGIISAVTTGVALLMKAQDYLNNNSYKDIAERERYLDQYRLSLVRLRQEDYETVFGTKTIAATSDAYKKMSEALAEYERTYRNAGGAFSSGDNWEYFDVGRAVKTGGRRQHSGDLRDMYVRTYKSLTGWFDRFTRLEDLAPELFESDGSLNVNAAKMFLETNTQITDEQRRQLQLIIDQKEAYEEASEAVDNTISGIFGSLASDITDIIWDSVVNGGGNAWERFRELGGDAVTKIGKQLLQEMVISEYLEQFRQQMRDAYALGSAADTQASLRNIVGQIFDGMGAMLEAGSVVAQEYQDWATEHGFDLAETTEKGRTAAAKAMTSVSQESWDVVDGKITNMMMRLLDIDDRFSVVQDVHLRMLERVTEISGHTARLERVDNNISALRSEIEDIRTRGVKIAQI